MADGEAQRTVLWLRNDLRVVDHPGFTAAMADASLLPVVVLSSRLTGVDRATGVQRCGPFRQRFLRESLEDLALRLKELGSGLVIGIGEPASVLTKLAEQSGSTRLLVGFEPCADEADEVSALRAATSVHLISYHARTMLDPDRLPMSISELPEVFSPFRRKVEKQWSVPEPLPTPKQLPPLPDAVEASDLAAAFVQAFGASTLADDPRCSFRFTGGTAAAEERLRRWIWDEDRLRRYKDTRNGMLGADFSSRFSPWLADGSLSARRVDAAIRHYEQERVANESTYWLRFEMLWRDFFQFLAAKHPRSLFHRGGLAGRDPVDRIHGPQVDAAFRQWCEGRTGDRLVDACMRELAATGWMSNRGRQNAASFLIHDLGVDWRRGAAWFEHLLVDYDPASNAGNWSSIAGLGRKAGHRFDTDRQAWTYDRKDRFQNHWLTEQPWT